MKLTKSPANPILSPLPNSSWESAATCNPGAYYKNGTFYLLYRAAGHDEEHFIHFGLATSQDGVHFERSSQQPVFSPSQDGPDAGCVEDARIVEFDDTFFVTYAYRPFPPGQYWTFAPDEVRSYDVPPSAPYALQKNVANSGLLMSKDLQTFRRLGRITQASLDDRDVILFPEKLNGKFYMLHRPKEWLGPEYGDCDYPGIWLSSSTDLLEWKDDVLLMKGEQDWERKIGGSTPPILTSDGWLTLYHGVDDKGIYRVGVILLDASNPAKVIARAPDFIMEPEHSYEWEGYYEGCVFPTGNVVVDGTLYVYYGGADKYCCLATCNLQELVDYVKCYPVS